MSERRTQDLPDQAQRDLILRELDKTMLVESAAGTGKTTSMVGRMIALLSENKCTVDSMAAVTFTRKAASELRSRFQVELEKAIRNSGAGQAHYLSDALNHIDNCFIGTIHSFCARLLRERPVEAGIDVSFKEIDDDIDGIILREAWDDYVNNLFAKNSPALGELSDLGIEAGMLKDTFIQYAQYQDVDEWPVPEITSSNLRKYIETQKAVEKLENYAGHIEELLPQLPDDSGNDKLIPKYQRISRMMRQADLSDLLEFMEIMEEFKEVTIVKKVWPKSGFDVENELDRWNNFRVEVAEPLMKKWRELRYTVSMKILMPAREIYDAKRKDSGVLNFQDLLMKTAALLRGSGDRPNIRAYFRKRFSHILVDEFQDTDPVQAEVMLLLTSDNLKETDWRQCRPVPGSLFVVGDPKQSIYRFRRADIITYNQVKRIIEENDGLLVTLSTNFRTISPILDWANSVFKDHFPEKADEYSPQHVPLHAGRMEHTTGELTGIRILNVQGKNNNEILHYESDFIAGFIRNAINNKMTVPRSQKEIETGMSCEVSPADFLIISRNTKNLSIYAQKLQEHGVPHQVTGGSAMNQVRELSLLHKCLKVIIDPENSPALVAVMRSELFGISDKALYDFKSSGGKFDYHTTVPDRCDENEMAAISDVFAKFQKYALWLSILSPVVAFEKIAEDLGLPATASAVPGGDVQVGSLYKALEILRSEQEIIPTTTMLLERMGALVAGEEKYDGLSARSEEAPAVRIMNLHKVKGLEAQVVFLADPTGEFTHNVEIHISRSEQKIRGYLAVYKKYESKGSVILAHPADWNILTDEESKFLSAEKKRLLYVAATRAGAQLIISQRKDGSNKNPWNLFSSYFSESDALNDAGPLKTPLMNRVRITGESINKGSELIRNGWDKILEPTYKTISVKKFSIPRGGLHFIPAERGTEWGSVIHSLLETAMSNPEIDLKKAAEPILTDYDFSHEFVDPAVNTVKSVMNSEIWKRALISIRRLMEVPFQTTAKLKKEISAQQPVILKGVIDLVFLERGRWVIVDYKTDTVTEDTIGSMIQHYLPQVRTYAQAWEECTGQSVGETGLFFTHLNQYHSEQFPSVP